MLMKKVFTLFAVAAMALSASAQDYTITYTDGTPASSDAMFDALNNQTWAPVDGLACGDIKMFLFHSDAKTYSGGNTWNGTDPADFNKKKPVKFSNGAANAIVLPAGVKIGKIEFIGYCNSTGATSWISTLGVAEGNTYKELYTNTGDESVAYMSKDDCTAGNALGKITVDLSKNPASDVIYFKNGGKQPAFFINLYKAADTPTGIDDIVSGDENAPVEYYNLQGVRINEPAAGQVVIRRQGSKVAKIIVR